MKNHSLVVAKGIPATRGASFKGNPSWIVGLAPEMPPYEAANWFKENLPEDGWELWHEHDNIYTLYTKEDNNVVFVRLRWPDCNIVERDASGCEIF